MNSKADFMASLPEPLRDPNNCWATEFDQIPYSYGYRPSLAAGVTFVVLFALALFYHTTMAVMKNRWTSIWLAYGAFAELIGWAGRTWASKCPYNQHAYLMQTVTLIIGPVFFTAALYVLLGQFIHIFGRESSLLSARLYTIVFLVCEALSLVIQVAGGVIAANASRNRSDPTPGTQAMLAGVVVQLAVVVAFAGLAADFVRRSLSLPAVVPGTGMVVTGPQRRSYHAALAALGVALACHVGRNVLRTAGLAGGWATGPLTGHEAYTVAVDGALMALAVGIFVALDPARVLEAAGLLPPVSPSVRRDRSKAGSGSVEGGSSYERKGSGSISS